jgi:hypothetical protein
VKLSKKEIDAVNECTKDVEFFLDLYEGKVSHFSHYEMGVIEEDEQGMTIGVCFETDYRGGIGFPKSLSRTMTTHIYFGRDFYGYMDVEFSYPSERLGRNVSYLKQMFMLIQGQFNISDDELYFALEDGQFKVIISFNASKMDHDRYEDLVCKIQYVHICSMYMLTDDSGAPKDAYVDAVSEQIR